MLMRGGYCRLKNLTHRNSQTLAALQMSSEDEEDFFDDRLEVDDDQ